MTDYNPIVLDGLPRLPKDMRLSEMIRLINYKHAEIRQLQHAVDAIIAKNNVLRRFG